MVDDSSSISVSLVSGYLPKTQVGPTKKPHGLSVALEAVDGTAQLAASQPPGEGTAGDDVS